MALLVTATLYLLYLFHLTATGMLGPDEPRYASIGRAMAQSGDWVTPRLWGQAWFEKPALLYWMTAAAFRLGLSQDLAPRLPVALLSILFLLFYAWILNREFGARAAAYATAMLATSAGWLAFSHVGVTDLPLAATFSAAMLLTLPWIGSRDRRWLIPAAAMLALSVLAKGLVPLVLALPVAWTGRNRLRDLIAPRPVLTFIAIALPWYALCTYRNGAPFLRTFFWEHHVARFTSGDLQHVQPYWYYLPVLLAALFPWTPMIVVLFRRDLYRDPRALFLLLWVAFGFLFFSAAINKLPGYLLPLIPALTALAGIALQKARIAGPLLFCSAGLLSLAPAIGLLLPEVLAGGSLRTAMRASHLSLHASVLIAVLCLAGAGAWYLERRSRDAAMALVFVLSAGFVVYLKAAAFPALEKAASARSLWRELRQPTGPICVGDVSRNWRYGLDYYSMAPLPDCLSPDALPAIVPGPGRPVIRYIKP